MEEGLSSPCLLRPGGVTSRTRNERCAARARPRASFSAGYGQFPVVCTMAPLSK